MPTASATMRRFNGLRWRARMGTGRHPVRRTDIGRHFDDGSVAPLVEARVKPVGALQGNHPENSRVGSPRAPLAGAMRAL